MAEQEVEISIEDLELSLEVYQIQSEQKLAKLAQLFVEKGKLDLTKMFYEERSSLEIKFQNIVGDLTEFLINQEIASTEKLRKTFYRILENPLLLLFKVSRFQIFNLRLNAFDIELDPIEAIIELSSSIFKNIDQYVQFRKENNAKHVGMEYYSYQEFLEIAKIHLIEDQIFILYSYLRKGGNILRKKFEDKVKIVEIFNNIEAKIIPTLLQNQNEKTLKELSILNYEIYLLESNFDVMCFFLKIPLRKKYFEVLRQVEILGQKGKQDSNLNLFILSFIRYPQEILAKIQNQGIDSTYDCYIQNVLTSLLDLWGCRLCYYHQYIKLFQLLFSFYSSPSKLLKICLSHNPDLKKDDIVLLRTNFKIEIQKKHGQFLSLLKKQSIEEINESLKAFYHEKLYNLDYNKESAEVIQELLTLLNGNSSIRPFFNIVEAAFRQWNHTVDFTYPQKYINSQFKYPNLENHRLSQSLRLFNNLCVLPNKGFSKEYHPFIKDHAFTKCFIGLALFLLQNQDCFKMLKDSELVQELLLNLLKFLQIALADGSGEWQNILLEFSSKMYTLPPAIQQMFHKQFKSIIVNNIETLHIKQLMDVVVHILVQEKIIHIEKTTSKSTLDLLATIFLNQVTKYNSIIKNFRFFDTHINDIHKQQLTKEEAEFLQRNAVINEGVIEVKNNGCLKLSQLQIITNPIHFDKVMDNYYFNLDGNAKKYIQFAVNEWISLLENKNPLEQIYGLIIQELIQNYPICLPVICSTRVGESTESMNLRFCEALTYHLNGKSTQILKKILGCRCVRFNNGMNYVSEEITWMVMKQCIKIINSKQGNHYTYQILTQCIQNIKPAALKVDLIVKAIHSLNFAILSSNNPQSSFALTTCHTAIMTKFFAKKSSDMRKVGLEHQYLRAVWNQVRTKVLQSFSTKKYVHTNITDQIMVSPFAISQDYNVKTYKIQKTLHISISQPDKEKIEKKISFSQISSLIEQKKQIKLINSLQKIQAAKCIDIKNLKISLEYYFGRQNIEKLCRKQNIKLLTKDGIINEQIQTIQFQQNESFINHYMWEMQIPVIQMELVWKHLLCFLKEEVQFGDLWATLFNMAQLFAVLLLIVELINSNVQQYSKEDDDLDSIIHLVLKDRKKSLQIIYKLFTKIAYTNLWSENFKKLATFPHFQALIRRFKFANLSEDSEDSFFGIALKTGLSNEFVFEDLNSFLGCFFDSKPSDQNSLMYNAIIDRSLLNLIMKSLHIPNLHKVSLLFHSNFNNLRLYTDQLHEGLKALNMASKNRSYNQFIKLSKEVDDEQFYAPMKLFQENFAFFLQIQKEGYNFKHSEEIKFGLEKIGSLLKKQMSKQGLERQIIKIKDELMSESEKLQMNIANRVKSFYLATKLRDLSYQNALTISMLQQILSEKGLAAEETINKIKKVQIFSLMSSLFNSIVLFDDSWDNIQRYHHFRKADESVISSQVNVCTTRRFSHSMSKIYEKCELEFDQVMQRCVDSLKRFLITAEGQYWLSTDLQLYPPFLTKNFISSQQGSALAAKIQSQLLSTQQIQPLEITITDKFIFTNVLKALRECDKKYFYQLNAIKICYEKQSYTLSQFLSPLKSKLLESETLGKIKNKNALILNRYKASEATLEEIEILGYIIGHCLINNLKIDLPLHTSIISAIAFDICDLDSLIDVDFKVWEDIKNVASIQDCKDLNLNFSYIFQSLESLQPQRVELIDKGASKKVNNLNRDEYCDSVCCYLVFEMVKKQIGRLLESILYVCPKEYISCKKISQILAIFYSNEKPGAENVMRRQMKKIGLMTPDSVLYKGNRIDNLKDYQNIEWLVSILYQNAALKQRLWKDESNIFVVTTIGNTSSVEVQIVTGLVIINHFNSQAEMKDYMLKNL